METFETNLETCFCSRSYTWTDLESIWYGKEACLLTFTATPNCEIFPWFMDKMNIILKSPELS